jgi:hypothetical protein
MDLLKFIVFSSLEYFVSFVFILIQFRFSLKENISKIVLISILLSFVSYSFIQADLRGISSLIQTIIFFVYIYHIMKVSIINSIIMVMTGYIMLGLVQTCLLAVLYHVGVIHGELVVGDQITYIVQVVSSLIILVLSFAIYYFNGGYSFIETNGRFSKTKLKGRNLSFVISLIGIFIVTIVTNMILLDTKDPPYLPVASILFFILLLFSYMTFRRDEHNG